MSSVGGLPSAGTYAKLETNERNGRSDEEGRRGRPGYFRRVDPPDPAASVLSHAYSCGEAPEHDHSSSQRASS